MYNAEGIGIMESATLRRYRIPYQIMGLHCLVAALVEVCPGGVTRGGGELREEHPNEAIGDGIDGFPAIFCPSDLGNDRRILRNQAHQLVYVRTKTQEQTPVGIALDVKVPLVA